MAWMPWHCHRHGPRCVLWGDRWKHRSIDRPPQTATAVPIRTFHCPWYLAGLADGARLVVESVVGRINVLIHFVFRLVVKCIPQGVNRLMRRARPPWLFDV